MMDVLKPKFEKMVQEQYPAFALRISRDAHKDAKALSNFKAQARDLTKVEPADHLLEPLAARVQAPRVDGDLLAMPFLLLGVEHVPLLEVNFVGTRAALHGCGKTLAQTMSRVLALGVADPILGMSRDEEQPPCGAS